MKYLIPIILLIFLSCNEDSSKCDIPPNYTKIETTSVNKLMDDWHHAATVADEDVFFGSMTADGVYIGTDASERWTRDEMSVWAKEIFKRDTAWAFTPLSRHIDFSEDGKTAWFDELLLTWMDTCRSSGVVLKVNNEWKIKHYHLSMAIPNKHVKSYLDLIKE